MFSMLIVCEIGRYMSKLVKVVLGEKSLMSIAKLEVSGAYQ